ncbi:MAG: hypothetical protein HY786_01980 [Deltaproteobacteria bacterium]|nr:hypothetical protein [Deltaproteobacteria bacterium]
MQDSGGIKSIVETGLFLAKAQRRKERMNIEKAVNHGYYREKQEHDIDIRYTNVVKTFVKSIA